ncbi:lysozyme [Erythrobacter crassostreae]|uniref:Lysozyme n=1 Tax=Erythrobacter crassostreae TaxID=2828328 RepID=A0A9X1F3G5_9SPHN|nr:lysozyme [Erythrobacter crassostrea]MBV7259281.1 lysozyme [Erythrobacter crassostrea]
MPQSRKPLFDTVRAVLKRGFRQSEVVAIDGALDVVIDPPETAVTDCVKGSGVPKIKRRRTSSNDAPRSIGPEGIALIKQFEGCARLKRDGLVSAYPDPGTGGAPWTIGWGATRGGLHGFVGADTVWTQAQCDERLEDDLKRYAADVSRAIGAAPTTQTQFDAMVSFHYNTGAIARATLTKKHIAGDFSGAAAEFVRWNKAGGRVLKGLVRRRSAEMALYRR